MGKITDALKKVADERVSRIQKKPDIQYVVKKVENSKIEPHIIAFHDPASPVGEQYKIIRTNIQSMRSKNDYKVFLVTSSMNGEGKTVTSVNLAMTMAHDLNGKSILLIDADMRKGKVARYLGINQNPGLSEILKGEIVVEQGFVSPNVDNFTVIPSGKVPKNPSELLASKNMIKLIDSVRTKFDYVFIDSPPVMPLTDPCIIGSLVDGALIVLQAGRTHRDMLKTVEGRLLQSHTKVLGYIMTGVEYHLPHYLYRYAHEYGVYDAYYAKGNEKKVEEVSVV